VPFLIRWPGQIRAGLRVDRIAGAIDLMPTLTNLAGVPSRAPKPFDGRDLSPVNDLRALFAGVLNQQWGLEAADLRSKVFSGGSPPSPLSGLIA
jgi:arylsulfatase A-like enzyme